MKKLVIFSIFLLLFLKESHAQGEFRFGLQISPSFSWINTENKHIKSNGPNTGLKLGILGEYYFAENYSFVSGLGFAFNQGGTLKYDNETIIWKNSSLEPPLTDTLSKGANLKYGIQYIEIPLGLKMTTKEFGYFSFFAEPNMTINLKTKARGSVEAVGIQEEKINIGNEVKGIALSWGIGAGMEYHISTSTALVAGIFYQNIFTDMTSDNSIDVKNATDNNYKADNSSATGSGLTIRLAVMF